MFHLLLLSTNQGLPVHEETELLWMFLHYRLFGAEQLQLSESQLGASCPVEPLTWLLSCAVELAPCGGEAYSTLSNSSLVSQTLCYSPLVVEVDAGCSGFACGLVPRPAVFFFVQAYVLPWAKQSLGEWDCIDVHVLTGCKNYSKR